MIENLPIDKIIQTALRHGAQAAEVFVEDRRSTTVACDDKHIESAHTYYDKGIGIRVIHEGHTAYGSTNRMDKRSLLSLAKSLAIASSQKKAKTCALVLKEKEAKSPTVVKEHPFGISLERKSDIVLRADDVARRSSKLITQAKIVYRDFVRRTYVASSEGTFARDEQVGVVLSLQVIASDGKIIQTGQEVIGGSLGFEIFEKTPPEEAAEKAARRAVKMLSAREAPAGTMAVVLSSEAGGTMIHEAVGHGLEADLALEGNSVYAGKLGEKVANELVTVVDDATLAGMRGSFTFDDEGTPAQRTVLIENGILKAYMSDLLRAKRQGLVSTGNARRQSYEHPPIVRMTNTLICSGKSDPAEILGSTHSGLFVKRMGGGQVNTVNGDFVFDVQEGYLIDGGKIGEPVRGATLIGNGPKILLAIDRVGTDLGFSIGTCGKEGQEAPVSCGQPTIRIPEIVVGGRG